MRNFITFSQMMSLCYLKWRIWTIFRISSTWNNNTSWWCTIKKTSYPDGNGTLAFIRLVASAYIIKHQIVFGDFLPPKLFVSLDSSDDIIQKHYSFITMYKPRYGIEYASKTNYHHQWKLLWHHWQRSIWVYDYWNQSCCNTITLLPVHLFGWARHDGDLSVEWDSPQNTLAVRERVAFLTYGYGCKTGCGTARCKCVKSKHHCRPGCS